MKVREETSVTRLENGDFVLELGIEDVKLVKKYPTQDLEIILNTLEEYGISAIGSEFCLSGFEMGCYLYDMWSDKGYILPFSKCLGICKGVPIEFQAMELDEEDRDFVNGYLYC